MMLLAQFLDRRILLELWSLRSEFSQKLSVVCAAGLDFRSSFGDVVSRAVFGIGKILVSFVLMSNFAHAKWSS